MESWSQLHQRLRASDQRRSWAGAMKRSRVRASLTTGATWAAASASIRTSSSLKDPRLDGLHDQNALQNAAIDERNSEERLVGVFARFTEVFEARMIFDLLDGDRPHLFRHKAREPFVHCHAKSADALRAKSERRGQHEVGSVRFQQIGRTDVGLKPASDQSDDIHEGLGWLAALRREIADLFQSQDVTGIKQTIGLAHVLIPCSVQF